MEVPEYHPNKEITGDYDTQLSAKCSNGTFVGQYLQDNAVKAWRGIPFAEIPGRFERSVEPPKSDKVYEALYYGKVCMQNPDESEPAGYYEQSESDCLTLTVYTGNNAIGNKPVFVYVHGGAYACGGTCDPMYDLTNLAYYYPDVVFVNVTYRLGVLGHINLGVKDDNGNYLLTDYEENEDKYNTSNNLAILDVIQALHWVKDNIAAFGGDINNITIGGESAGAGMVSNILMMASDSDNNYVKKDEKLFNKVFSMSGGINQYNSLDDAANLTKLLLDFCKEKGKDITTVKQLQELSYEDMKEFWANYDVYGVFNVLDGLVIPTDPYETYNRVVKDDYIVLQGATTSEYDYFRPVFEPLYQAYGISHEACAKAVYWYLTDQTMANTDLTVTDEFMDSLNTYMNELTAEGYETEEDRLNILMNDHYLQTVNYYMAQKQADNGGTTYCYAFDEPYNPPYEEAKAGHGIDCNYFFGNFNGGKALGTNEQVDFSRKYQDMFVNFLKTGNPSTNEIKWEPYNRDTGYIALLNKEKTECVREYNKVRIDTAIAMIDQNEAMKYALPWSYMIPMAVELCS